jgi:hypothetical protein
MSPADQTAVSLPDEDVDIKVHRKQKFEKLGEYAVDALPPLHRARPIHRRISNVMRWLLMASAKRWAPDDNEAEAMRRT